MKGLISRKKNLIFVAPERPSFRFGGFAEWMIMERGPGSAPGRAAEILLAFKPNHGVRRPTLEAESRSAGPELTQHTATILRVPILKSCVSAMLTPL